MNKIKSILKKQFNINCVEIIEIHGGLSAMNYKIITTVQPFFLKVYDKKKTQSSLWIENIDCYMPILMWLNENTKLNRRIVRPLKTNGGAYRFDDEENVYLLFDFINGETAGKSLSPAQLLEAADIMACLHSYSDSIPVNTNKIKEDFSIPFCYSLENFISEKYPTTDIDIKKILKPCLIQLIETNNKVKQLSEQIKQKDIKFVLCHTDAHGYNLMQSRYLILVDWEGIKLSPAEADLIMFSKKEYWDIFIKHYKKLRSGFELDNDIFNFYILRRKIEDIWAFIEGILYDNLTFEERERDLNYYRSVANH